MKTNIKSTIIIVACIVLGSLKAFAQPTVAAPTPPTRTAAKVISIFSDAYTNVTGTNFNPWWNQSTLVTTVQIAGNSTLKYESLNYQGTELAGSVNALTMNRLHIDIWTSNSTTLKISPISLNPTKEMHIALTPLTQNQWNSYDLDLSLFTGVDFSAISQFIIVGNGTVYIDNLYFYDNTATVDTEAPTAFTATVGAITSDEVEFLLRATDNSGAVNYSVTYGTTTVTTGGVSGIQKSFKVGNLQGGTAYSFSIVAQDATGNTASNSPIVLNATTAAAIPAAPTPTRPASNVISIFSDAYTSATPAANYFPGWGQATVASIIDLGGTNKTIKYAGLNYQGIELGVSINASTMTTLHVDAYTENETSLKITPISPGKELLVSLTPLVLNTWNSFDIPLSSFTGVNKADIIQFKFEGSGGKTVYVDNLYFHDGTTNVSRIELNKSASMYPTNVSDIINIKSETQMSQVIIRNIVGQKLQTIDVLALEKSIDMSSIAAGNYLVTVHLTNGEQTTQKIIKL